MGANSFLFRENPFQKGLDVQEGKQEVKKVVSFKKIAENLSSVPSPLNSYMIWVLTVMMWVLTLVLQISMHVTKFCDGGDVVYQSSEEKEFQLSPTGFIFRALLDFDGKLPNGFIFSTMTSRKKQNKIKQKKKTKKKNRSRKSDACCHNLGFFFICAKDKKGNTYDHNLGSFLLFLWLHN